MKLILRVLAMDDEVIFRQQFQALLKRGGLDVRIARSVPHLFKMAAEDSYDASLIDIRLTEGGCEGLDAVRQLREIHPDMYIEVITGHDEFKSQSLEMGADAVFIKPEGTEGLEAAQRIRTGIVRKSLTRLAQTAGIDLEELANLQLLDSNGRSALVAVKASVVNDCILQIGPLLEPIAQKHNLDRQTMDSLKQDFMELFTKQVIGAELRFKYHKEVTSIAHELANDVNFREYLKNREALRKDYLDQYVAFIGAELVEADSDIEALLRKVHDKHGPKPAFIKKITAAERRVTFRRPKVAKRR